MSLVDLINNWEFEARYFLSNKCRDAKWFLSDKCSNLVLDVEWHLGQLRNAICPSRHQLELATQNIEALKNFIDRNNDHIEAMENLIAKYKACLSLKEEQLRQHEDPELHFYCHHNDNRKWILGFPHQLYEFREKMGLTFIHFCLLSYPDQALSPLEVYHRRKEPPADEIEWHGVAREYTDNFNLDEKGKRDISIAASLLEEKIQAETDPGNAAIMSEELDLLRKQLERAKIEKKKPTRDPKSAHELTRTNVTKHIKLTLNEIHAKAPVLAVYLNEDTIRTGDRIGYFPRGKMPRWILRDPDEHSGK